MVFFKDKRFRYGTFSTAMMLFAFVLFVLVNLVADEFNRSYDLTPEQIFSLTWRSHDFLETLEDDVLITHVTPVGHGNPWYHYIAQLLIEYDSLSPHITTQERDPMLNPTLMHYFAAQAGIDDGVRSGSVVVQSGDKIRIIDTLDMLRIDIDPITDTVVGILSYNFEAQITRAIHYVTLGDPAIVYYAIGSGEAPLDPELEAFLRSENFEVREINLVADDIPEDADILMLTVPARDWTQPKADRVIDFLMDDGRAFVATNFVPEVLEHPIFNGVLASYGISVINHIVLEADTRHIFQQSPIIIMPIQTNHEIFANTADRDFINMVFRAAGIETLDARRNSTTVEPLWTTSRDAFARVDIMDARTAQLPDDIPGPFDLAVAITDTRFVETQHTTKMVVVGNLAVIGGELNALTGGGNFQFILDSLRWLHGQPPSIFVPGRVPPGAAPILITTLQANVLNGIAVAALPVMCIVIGVFVWFRRRYN